VSRPLGALTLRRRAGFRESRDAYGRRGKRRDTSPRCGVSTPRTGRCFVGLLGLGLRGLGGRCVVGTWRAPLKMGPFRATKKGDDHPTGVVERGYVREKASGYRTDGERISLAGGSPRRRIAVPVRNRSSAPRIRGIDNARPTRVTSSPGGLHSSLFSYALILMALIVRFKLQVW